MLCTRSCFMGRRFFILFFFVVGLLQAQLSHDNWNDLLQQYVSEKGEVDYDNFDRSALEDYLNYLGTNTPEDQWTKADRLAYYINLYNAATVALILDNYPLQSIKDLKKPWGRKWIRHGDQTISLNHIEHGILRKMNEPRIHFAINCASISCPNLANTAYTPHELESQLQQATKAFFTDTTKNDFRGSTPKISALFKWFKKDFTQNGSLADYINPYLDQTLGPKTKFEYLTYDWGLNKKP
ncbi:hypothetical protein B7P33_01030 [Sediminicola luteus]|uniref:DUF547 domain-containing protein n=2 Tax=Sediminicola luteus TaxID=319238 RepID=A0A2A4GD72_9FLAO|nr:hypothetical protein B7P33_01030 [Sediminicola luteus]